MAGGFDQGVEGGGARSEPLQGFCLDGEMLGVAGLHVGLDQGVEPAALAGLVARPGFDEAAVLLLGQVAGFMLSVSSVSAFFAPVSLHRRDLLGTAHSWPNC